MPSLTIRPGSNVRLKGQSEYVPDFLVVRCEGDQCWVRQKNWTPEAQLQIRVTQIAIPTEAITADGTSISGTSLGSMPAHEAPRSHRKPCEVISMAEYRMRRKR
ncbi:MAG TPA: hypothetical protein V6D29_15535 [Leptolyngbyaceae cyanobacterium]